MRGGRNMNYFQVVCFVFGALILLTRPAMHLFPKKWNDFELNTAYTEKQPSWVWVVAGIGALLVAFTWYQHFTADVPNSLVITLILSLTLIKTSQVLFNYAMFRKFVVRVLTKDRKILAAINVIAVILGVAVISIGVLLY
jgi:hypothetical protein